MFLTFRRFFRLSCTEKRVFVEAFLTLCVMRPLSLFVNFKHLIKPSRHQENAQDVFLNEKDYALVLTVKRGIQRAAKYTPWQSVCLTQSLAAKWMLQRRGVPGILFLGVGKDDCGALKAHSWSKCGDVIVTGETGMDEFKVVSAFVWD